MVELYIWVLYNKLCPRLLKVDSLSYICLCLKISKLKAQSLIFNSKGR